MSDPVAPLYRWRREFVLVLVVAALVGVLAHAPSAFRLATVLPAVFICPGLALVGAIGLDNRATVLRLTIPVSAAFSLLVAQTLLTTHAFAPRAGLAIICGVCAAAVAVDYTLGFRRRRA